MIQHGRRAGNVIRRIAKERGEGRRRGRGRGRGRERGRESEANGTAVVGSTWTGDGRLSKLETVTRLKGRLGSVRLGRAVQGTEFARGRPDARARVQNARAVGRSW